MKVQDGARLSATSVVVWLELSMSSAVHLGSVGRGSETETVLDSRSSACSVLAISELRASEEAETRLP